MSRPGSTSPTRSRPLSRANNLIDTQKSTKSISPRNLTGTGSRRALPLTPCHSPAPLSYRESPLSDRPSSSNRSPRVRQASPASKASLSDDGELEKAASLLIGEMDNDDVELLGDNRLSDTDPSQPSPRPGHSRHHNKVISPLSQNLLPRGSDVRPATPHDFRIRYTKKTPLKPTRSEPVKATHSMPDVKTSVGSVDGESENASVCSDPTKSDLKVRYLSEMQEKKMNQETLDTLQREYNDLLKKHAEAENTIDELRLGAHVTLYGDSPAPAPALSGTLPPAQLAQTFTLGKASSVARMATSLHGKSTLLLHITLMMRSHL